MWSSGLIRTALLAVALGAITPGSADAQVRERKQHTRITGADRKAAAEARKAKMAGVKKNAAAKRAAGAGKTGGTR